MQSGAQGESSHRGFSDLDRAALMFLRKLESALGNPADNSYPAVEYTDPAAKSFTIPVLPFNVEDGAGDDEIASLAFLMAAKVNGATGFGRVPLPFPNVVHRAANWESPSGVKVRGVEAYDSESARVMWRFDVLARMPDAG